MDEAEQLSDQLADPEVSLVLGGSREYRLEFAEDAGDRLILAHNQGFQDEADHELLFVEVPALGDA